MYFCAADLKGFWPLMGSHIERWRPLVRVQGFLTLQYDVIYKCVGL